MAAGGDRSRRRGSTSRVFESIWLLLLLLAPLALPRSAIGQQDTPEAPPPMPPQEIVRSIHIEGLEFYSETTILDALEQKVGEPLDFEAMRRSMTRLYESYRLIVQWGVRKVDGGIEIVMEATESPVDFEPRFVGNAEISKKKLLEWIGLPEEPVAYLAQSERLRQRIVEAYKRHGFHFVEVNLVTHEDPPDVIFEILEGPEVRCTRVLVNGNDAIPDTGWGFWRGGLRELGKMETKGRGPFSWWGKIFDEEVLAADLVALKNVYRDRGWLDVEADERLEFNDARDEVVVHLTIDEGPLYRVASLGVRAFAAPTNEVDEDVASLEPEELVFPEADLLAACKLVPGSPFEAERLASDQRAMQEYYGERGYIDANLFERRRDAGGQWIHPEGWMWLAPAQVVDYERKEVHLTYRMHQGRPRLVREVLVRGNEHTRDKVLRREVNVLPGQTANLREIKRSLGRIMGTGYFSDQMDPEHRDAIFVLHETDDPDQIDVEYLVTEGRVVDFQISGGVTSDNGLVGLLSLGMRNFDASSPPDSLWSTFGDIYRKEAFHGNGELLMIDVSPGTEVNSARLRYTFPDLFGTHFDRWTANFDARLQDRAYDSHDEDRARIEFELGRIFDFDHKFDVGLVYQKVDLDNLSEDDVLPDTLIASEGKSSFHGLSAGYTFYDLDNRISPSDGVYFHAASTAYGGVLGGDEDFVKSELIFDWYDRVGEEELGTVGPAVYLGAAAGVAAPYGDTDSVNYAERFFLGGSLTMRGFDFRGVGPFVDENGKFSEFAIGGETYLRGSAELRFPLYTVPLPGTTRRREMFRGIFFLDWGVLGPEAFHLAIDELRVSAGFAFGLAYPIPLTFNFGWPLLDGPGDQTEVFSFRLQFR